MLASRLNVLGEAHRYWISSACLLTDRGFLPSWFFLSTPCNIQVHLILLRNHGEDKTPGRQRNHIPEFNELVRMRDAV
jgi:hypothetical protein